MNTDTGQVYRGTQAILDAVGRGESVVDVSEHVANAVEIGNRAIKAARAYVRRTPETVADHAAVASADAKRQRRRQRNLSNETES
jgi:hypothetical protein